MFWLASSRARPVHTLHALMIFYPIRLDFAPSKLAFLVVPEPSRICIAGSIDDGAAWAAAPEGASTPEVQRQILETWTEY